MDADGGGHETGSEQSLYSSDLSQFDHEIKKPCEICGSVSNEDMLMTCHNCRDTRTHTYCTRVLINPVPAIWICDECSAARRINQVDQTASTTSFEDVDKEVNMIASLAHTSPLGNEEEASSHVPTDVAPVNVEEELPDANLASDSESAI